MKWFHSDNFILASSILSIFFILIILFPSSLIEGEKFNSYGYGVSNAYDELSYDADLNLNSSNNNIIQHVNYNSIINNQYELDDVMDQDNTHKYASTVMRNMNRVRHMLPRGAFTFNTPKEMNINDFSTIHLFVTPGLDTNIVVDPMLREIDREGLTDDSIRTRFSQVSPVMRADLSGSAGFEITSGGPADQALSDSSATHWIWRIKSNKSGQQFLSLRLFTILGSNAPLETQTFQETVYVKISVIQEVIDKINKYYGFIVALVLSPIYWIIKYIRKLINSKSNYHKPPVLPRSPARIRPRG